jgi:urease accessory protein
MFDAVSASDSALQRSHGEARLRFAADATGQSRLKERYASSPARLLTPRTHGEAPEAVLANTAGGVAGGDSLSVSVECGPGADGVVSGQAAEKIYRALDAPAKMQTKLRLDAGATLEWLPQETILFNGALLNRQINVDLADDARLLMAETIVLGRKAHNETFASGCLTDYWRIDRAGQPLWRDRMLVEGGGDSLFAATGFRSARALATMIYAAPDAAAHTEYLQTEMANLPIFAGATHVRGLLIARMLGDDAGALKSMLADVIGAFRHRTLDRPATAPRVWLC